MRPPSTDALRSPTESDLPTADIDRPSALTAAAVAATAGTDRFKVLSIRSDPGFRAVPGGSDADTVTAALALSVESGSFAVYGRRSPRVKM